MIADAFFVSGDLIAREVELPDGSKHEIHFRELPVVEFRRFQLAEQSENEDKRAGSMAALIAASVCDPDGNPAMTAERAARLKPAAADAFVKAILDVNGLGSAGKNVSPAEA